MVENLPCCWRLGEGIFEEDQRIWTEDDYLCCQTKPFSLVVRSTSFPVLYFKRTSLRVVEGIGGPGRSRRTLRAADFHIEDLFCQSTKTFILRLYSQRLFTQRKNKNFHFEAHKKYKTFTLRLYPLKEQRNINNEFAQKSQNLHNQAFS